MKPRRPYVIKTTHRCLKFAGDEDPQQRAAKEGKMVTSVTCSCLKWWLVLLEGEEGINNLRTRQPLKERSWSELAEEERRVSLIILPSSSNHRTEYQQPLSSIAITRADSRNDEDGGTDQHQWWPRECDRMKKLQIGKRKCWRRWGSWQGQQHSNRRAGEEDGGCAGWPERLRSEMKVMAIQNAQGRTDAINREEVMSRKREKRWRWWGDAMIWRNDVDAEKKLRWWS